MGETEWSSISKTAILVLLVLLISAVLAGLYSAGAPIGVLIGILFWILVALYALPRH